MVTQHFLYRITLRKLLWTLWLLLWLLPAGQLQTMDVRHHTRLLSLVLLLACLMYVSIEVVRYCLEIVLLCLLRVVPHHDNLHHFKLLNKPPFVISCSEVMRYGYYRGFCSVVIVFHTMDNPYMSLLTLLRPAFVCAAAQSQ
jgi:hypothetical protein